MSTFVDVPEIKLIRTDTTLDLSQKAEKVCLIRASEPALVAWGRNLKPYAWRKTHTHGGFAKRKRI